jgi:hypothetical protein
MLLLLKGGVIFFVVVVVVSFDLKPFPKRKTPPPPRGV